MLSLGTGILLGLGLIANSQNFTNPVIYEDFPDNDIFLGPDGKTFYFLSSSLNYSLGTLILQSTNLVNWS